MAKIEQVIDMVHACEYVMYVCICIYVYVCMRITGVIVTYYSSTIFFKSSRCLCICSAALIETRTNMYVCMYIEMLQYQVYT